MEIKWKEQAIKTHQRRTVVRLWWVFIALLGGCERCAQVG